MVISFMISRKKVCCKKILWNIRTFFQFQWNQFHEIFTSPISIFFAWVHCPFSTVRKLRKFTRTFLTKISWKHRFHKRVTKKLVSRNIFGQSEFRIFPHCVFEKKRCIIYPEERKIDPKASIHVVKMMPTCFQQKRQL